MARIGYARVSTIDQDLDTQLARLKAEGCGLIRSEKVSRASRDGRTERATIIEFLRKRPTNHAPRLAVTREKACPVNWRVSTALPDCQTLLQGCKGVRRHSKVQR